MIMIRTLYSRITDTSNKISRFVIWTSSNIRSSETNCVYSLEKSSGRRQCQWFTLTLVPLPVAANLKVQVIDTLQTLSYTSTPCIGYRIGFFSSNLPEKTLQNDCYPFARNINKSCRWIKLMMDHYQKRLFFVCYRTESIGGSLYGY